MADLKLFNQDGVNKMIEEITNLPCDERSKVCEEIRKDLRCFIFKNFIVSEGYQRLLNQVPNSSMRELGFGCAMALEEKNWTLTIEFPGGEPPPAGKCKETKQTVGTTYNPNTGPTVSKTVSWSWN